jgi:hypothetical protein
MVDVTEQTVRQAPFIEQRSEQLLASIFGDPTAERRTDESGAFTETEADFNLRKFGRAGIGRQIPSYQVAGFSPDQLEAMRMGRLGLGGFAPHLTAAQGTLGSGIAALQQGMPITQAGANLLQTGAPLMQAGAPLVQEGAQALTGADISQYFDPYQDYVTDEIIKQGDIATTKAGDAAQKYGAFGGSRQGVVEGTIAADTAARVGQARSTGYGQALQAAEAAKKRSLYGGQGLGQLGTGLGQLGAGLSGIGSRFGQFGTQLGQLGGAQAGLGLDAQRAGLTDVSSLMGIGGLNQQLAQAGIDAARGTEEARQLEPFTRMGWASDILQGQPSSYSTYTTRTGDSVSPYSQIAGLGLAGLGAYNKGLWGNN